MATAAKKTAAKAAPAPAPKPAAKKTITKAAAPAPTPEPEPEEEVAGFEVGQTVEFLGYDADTPEAEQVLTAGEHYAISAITEPEGDDPGGNPVVLFDNPEFNEKKKEHPETNPRQLEVEVFAEEVTLVEQEEEQEEEAAAEEIAEAPAAPAAKKAAAKTTAKPAAKTAVAAKKTAAAKKVAEPKPEPEPEVDPLEVDLENEDPEVLALIEGSENLIETAQTIEAQAATSEFQLGGLLYHIKKTKAFLQVEGGTEYADKGGFEKFLQEYFNIEYRKAMYLIQIYVYFSLAAVEDAATKVSQIGWAKAQKISKLLTVEGANVDQLIELAETSTSAELSEAIKDQVEVGGTPGAKKTRITLKFRYLEDEGASINAILEEAKAQLALKDIGEALSHIVNAWASEQAGGTATAAKAPTQRPVAAKKTVAAKKVATKA